MDPLKDYASLYALQDKVLQVLSSLDTGFYLTGGTCLHRFYVEKRFSDDLDFFCNDNDLFRDYAREVLGHFKNLGFALQVEVDTRDFIRILFENHLKVDFVNDRVYRLGRTQKSPKGYSIDNISNILANKITAVIGRDDPKDVFDIVTIYLSFSVSWKEIMEASLKKCYFEKDFLIDRLLSFPEKLLDYLSIIDRSILDQIPACLQEITELISEQI